MVEFLQYNTDTASSMNKSSYMVHHWSTARIGGTFIGGSENKNQDVVIVCRLNVAFNNS